MNLLLPAEHLHYTKTNQKLLHGQSNKLSSTNGIILSAAVLGEPYISSCKSCISSYTSSWCTTFYKEKFHKQKKWKQEKEATVLLLQHSLVTNSAAKAETLNFCCLSRKAKEAIHVLDTMKSELFLLLWYNFTLCYFLYPTIKGSIYKYNHNQLKMKQTWWICAHMLEKRGSNTGRKPHWIWNPQLQLRTEFSRAAGSYTMEFLGARN